MTDVPQDVTKALLRTQFVLFLRKVFETIDPGVTYLHNWHIDAIVYEVMELIEGRNRRLIVNMPPRYLKSIILSVALPAWILGRDPTARVICISYSGELAAKFSRDFRRVLLRQVKFSKSGGVGSNSWWLLMVGHRFRAK